MGRMGEAVVKAGGGAERQLQGNLGCEGANLPGLPGLEGIALEAGLPEKVLGTPHTGGRLRSPSQALSVPPRHRRAT